MKDKCFCNTPEAGPVGNVSFRFNGLDFTAFKRGGQCSACVQNSHVILFEKYKEKIFKNGIHSGGNIDWGYFVKCEKARDEWNNTFEEISALLLALGVLSDYGQGNWEITDCCKLNLNPSPFCAPVYFTQKKDVLEYAKLKYGNSLYPWSIQGIGEVIPKKTVLEIA